MSANKYKERMLKVLAGLHSDMRDKVERWLLRCTIENLPPIYVYSGYRTAEEQQAILDKAKTSGKWLSSAKPGQSYHQYGQAIDYCFLLPDMYNQPTPNWDDRQSYKRANALAHHAGLRTIPGESCHLQNMDYKSYKDLPKFPEEV